MRQNMLASLPIVAILRGIVPERCASVAEVLYRAGIRAIEVPLNSPDALVSVAALRAALHADCVVGAGTVLSESDVQQVHRAGGELIVAPNVDMAVIRCALQLELDVIPGFATPTEAFQAIRAGATTLKLFPAATYAPAHLKAVKAVLPKHIRILPVGGIGAEHVAAWWAAGADGFGFGSEVFAPNYSLTEIEQRAARLVAAVREAQQRVRGSA